MLYLLFSDREPLTAFGEHGSVFFMGRCCLIESLFQGAAIFDRASVADIWRLFELRTDFNDKIRTVVIAHLTERTFIISGEIGTWSAKVFRGAVPSVQAGIVRHASPTGLLKNQMSFHLLCNSGAILPEISSDCLEGFPVVERCSDLSAFVKG